MSERPGAADPALVAEVLRVLEELRDPDGDPQLEAVRAAILLEDSLGIVLADGDITPDVLGDQASVAALLQRRGDA